MSLTSSDLEEIRNIIDSALFKQTQDIIQPIQNELEAIRNDLKDIYDMIAELQSKPQNSKFDKLPLENKILLLHEQLVAAAKQAGVTLPK